MSLIETPHVISGRVPAMVWSHDGNDDRIRWSDARREVGGAIVWPAPQLLSDRRTSNVPSIAGVGSGMCMAWKGSGSDKQIWFSRLNRPIPNPLPLGSGYTWSTQIAVRRFETPTFPTLVQYDDRMFMFWKSISASEHRGMVRWSELRGDQWVHPETGDDDPAAMTLDWIRTDDGVALAQHRLDRRLYMAWRRGGTDGRIDWASFDGHVWTLHDSPAPHRTGSVPALASDGRDLHMAWRQATNNHIEWSVLRGTTWSPPHVLNDRRSVNGPALGVLGTGRLVMAWVGALPDVHIWWSEYNNGQWGGQQAFSDRKMHVGLRVDFA